jgi:hypothetical protein
MRATRAAAAAAAPRAGPAIAGLVHLRSRVPKSAQADERLLQTAKALAADSRAARAEHEAHADRLAKGFDEAQKQVCSLTVGVLVFVSSLALSVSGEEAELTCSTSAPALPIAAIQPQRFALQPIFASSLILTISSPI